MKNQILLGECSELMSTFPPEIVDLTVTSPPYDSVRDYQGFTFDYRKVIDSLFRITKRGGVCVWVVGDQTINGSESGSSFEHALHFKNNGWLLHDTMIYYKSKSIYPAKNRYSQVFEYMFVCSKEIPPKTVNIIKDRRNKSFGRTLTGSQRAKDGSLGSEKNGFVEEFSSRFNIWMYDVGFNLSTKDEIAFEHPAIFPEALARDHIISWSNEGDLVFDPFSGSGTVAKQAFLNRRDYLGCEISEDYLRISQTRLAGVRRKQRL
jgi:DNA modification methylase